MRLRNTFIKILCFCLTAALIGSGIFYFTKKQNQPFYATDSAMNTFLLKLQEAALAGDKTGVKLPNGNDTVYAANFNGKNHAFEIDVSAQKEGKKLLWLGSTEAVGTIGLDKFDVILTSTLSLREFFLRSGQKTVFFPMYAPQIIEREEAKKQYIALIGNPQHIEDILIKKQIFYRKYSLSNPDEIKKDMPQFKAIFIESAQFGANALDIHPLVLTAIASKIPLATFWSWPDDDAINLFNDRINFYMYPDDGERLVDEIETSAPAITKRAEKAKELIEREYSPAKAAARLKALNTDRDSAYQKNSIRIDLPVAVGHTGSGDYWLAQDLTANFEKKKKDVDLTFFNSYYKYPTEANILVRGFLPSNERDFFAPINILYVAYAQFAQDNTREYVPHIGSYLQDLLKVSHKVDAIVTASKTLAGVLKNYGVNAYYVSQFTNPERFYPDYHDELKSEVFFVGVNTFYRKAAHILLKHNLPITIYGPGWGDKAKGLWVDNRELRKYYSSAKIVLNDTREGMKAFDFLSNRIFDASACNTLVISDYQPQIEAIYGDSVPMYQNEEELVKLVKYYLSHDEERKEKAAKARDITLKYFTAEKASERFLEIIDDIKKQKGL